MAKKKVAKKKVVRKARTGFTSTEPTKEEFSAMEKNVLTYDVPKKGTGVVNADNTIVSNK